MNNREWLSPYPSSLTTPAKAIELLGDLFDARRLLKYRADIDGMRAAAVVAVVLYHANARLLPGGFVGVDVFFVISGFVVSASLAEACETGVLAFIGEFYARRLARIAPALLVMLTGAAFAATLFVPQAWLSSLSERTALAAFLGISNWVMQGNADTYFAPRAELDPYTHTWSLGVEEQFYLVCPLLLFMWVRARSGPKSMRARLEMSILAMLGGASLLACIWASQAQPTAAFYSIFYRFWELAAGALLFQLSALEDPLGHSRFATIASYSPWIGVALVGIAMVFATADHFPSPWAIVVVGGSLLLIGGVGSNALHPVRRCLANHAVVWIGKRSYSLYLWHWPIFVLMRWTVGLDSVVQYATALVATAVAGAASFAFVERPFRHNVLLEQIQPVGRIAVFVLAIAVARMGVQQVFWHSSRLSFSTVSRNAVDWYAGNSMPSMNKQRRPCDVEFAARDLAGGQVYTYRTSRCSIAPSSLTLTILGDSHAGMYLPMLEELSAEQGMAINIYEFPGCPYLDLLMPMTEGKPNGCVPFQEAASREVVEYAHPGDILFLPSLRQWRFGDQWASFNRRNMDSLISSPIAKGRMARATAEAITWLLPFSRRGMAVIFEAPTPIFRSPAFRCSDRFNASNPVCRGGLSQPRAYLEKLRRPVVAAMDNIAGELPAVSIWDPFALLCPTTTCSSTKEGRPLFFDGDHLSAYANVILYPSFKSAVAAARAGSAEVTPAFRQTTRDMNESSFGKLDVDLIQ